MNRDKIGTQTCYVHQHNLVRTLMYIACLCPNLVSVYFYAIPILHFKFPNFFYLLVLRYTIYTMSVRVKWEIHIINGH